MPAASARTGELPGAAEQGLPESRENPDGSGSAPTGASGADEVRADPGADTAGTAPREAP
ncbi:hypothetical protein ACFOWE_24590 [Planomonospora corallina]|uniref:Uncharacterized protein n=1 Tax=Planomonospora corallina TaxID=1806052 RepID=A0ABV8IBE7_9ACTN